MIKTMTGYSMNRKAMQATKSHFKNKRPIRKAFPNKWANAIQKSHCCDAKAINNFVENKSGVCSDCGRKTTFRLVA